MMKLVLVLCVALAAAETLQQSAQVSANPLRRVVQMLQKMEKKVTEEGEKQKEMFEKYMCYCETSEASLSKSIADAEERVPQILAEIKQLTEEKVQLDADLVQHKKDRSEAQESIDAATAKREKEAAAFAKESGDSKSNIDALARAIPAIEKGMAGSFMQTAAGVRVAALLKQADVHSNYDSESVQSFLQGASQYSPGSGEIVGILKQMKDTMEKDLKEITESENESISVFESLVAAKEKEIAAATSAIESKTQRSGECAVAIANAKHDNEDTIENLEDDKKFLADLKKNCGTQESNWELISKTRQQEIVAIAETIRILNNDDALELFKKSIPSGESFLQMQVSSKTSVARALVYLKSASKDNRHAANFELITLALKGKKAGFEKVVKMIDEMVTLLKKEAKDDLEQKEWCAVEQDKSEDTIKELEHHKEDLATAIAEHEEGIKTLASEIEALEDGIAALDKQVTEATAQRKEEHEDFTVELANQNAALEILAFAKNRLNKFYNPKMYVAPQTPVPTEEQRQYFAATGEIPPELTAAPQIIPEAFVQLAGQTNAAPAPPPSALPAYKKSSSSSNGVLGMLDGIINEAKMEVKQMEMEEKEAQKDYETMVADAAKKRADDSKTITDKDSAKADLEEDLSTAKDNHKNTAADLSNTKGYLAKVHGECDWLVENFDVRKGARVDEIESLEKAKAVLSGADYSFVQESAFLSKRA